MSRIAAPGLALALTITTLAACAGSGDDGIGIDATGTVLGLVWVDRNGNTERDGSDAPAPDVGVRLVPASGGEAAYSAESGPNGIFIIPDVLVGDYRVEVDEATVGDTLRILRVDSATVTVAANDSSAVTVGLTFPAIPIDSARRQPPETRLFVEGLALTRWNVFGEQSLYVRDSTAAIRAVRVPSVNVVPGDSVRVLGVMDAQTGQPVIRDGVIYRLRTGIESPPPVTITTAAAAAADGGRLDADLVHLDSAVVTDSTRNSIGELILTVSDGSGPVDVLFDGSIQGSLSFPDGVIGVILDVTGILAQSSPGGSWSVLPRSGADVVVGPLSYPALDVVDARDQPAGTRLVIEGYALNSWATFQDSTVHVRDRSGAIRAVRVRPENIRSPADLVPGDSIRVVGTMGSVDGQPVLTRVTIRRIAPDAAEILPVERSTSLASRADGGSLDADLVSIDGAEVQESTTSSAGDFVLTVDDGSGRLDVVLDRDINFRIDFGGQINGTVLTVTGLLVPSGNRWVLKPRASTDVVVE